MKTAFSNPTYAKKMMQMHQQRFRLNPPAIPFKPEAKKTTNNKKKSEDEEDDDQKYTKIYLRIYPDDDNMEHTHEVKVPIFTDGTAEDWIKWYMEFEKEIVPNFPLDTAAKKNSIMKRLLGGRARERFIAGVNSVPMVLDRENNPVPPPANQQWKAGVKNVSKTKPITAYNPQGNSVIERVHQVLGNALRTFELQGRELDSLYPFDEFLSVAAYAIRCTYHTTLRATPGQLVFGRDMVLPTQFIADWASIALRKQKEIDKSNDRENSKRISYNYHVGDQVLVDKPGILPKMEAPRDGPYTVAVVHSNGTLTIQKGPVTERINVRRLQPYFGRST